MPHARKKAKVYHIPREKRISITSYSASADGERVVTHSSLLAPPDEIPSPSTSASATAQDDGNHSVCDGEEDLKGKKRYTSTVCVLYSDLLLYFVVVCSLSA